MHHAHQRLPLRRATYDVNTLKLSRIQFCPEVWLWLRDGLTMWSSSGRLEGECEPIVGPMVLLKIGLAM